MPQPGTVPIPTSGAADLHVVGGDPQVTRQGKLESATEGDAVQRGDRRLSK